MWKSVRIWSAGVCALAALVVAACGAGSAPPVETATSPPTRTSGPVSIATDHSAYAGNDVMTVTIFNQRATPIYAWDTRASCSILDLQVRQGDQWVGADALRCPLGRVALAVEIAPGARYITRIGSQIMAIGTAPPLAAGAYRLELTYFDTPSLSAQPPPTPTTIYSATLTVSGTIPPPIGT